MRACVRMCGCMYVLMHVSLNTYVLMHARLMHARVDACMCGCMYVRKHMYAWMHVCADACMRG